MTRAPKPSARALAIIALAMWSASLFLLAFTTVRTDEWRGFELLAEGWLGPFRTYAAWYANPLLLWAGRAILKGRGAHVSAGVAALLACDTVRVHEIVINEAGGTTTVDGWGWGAVLWGLSIAVMLAAAGTRAIELIASATQMPGKAPAGAWMRPLGLLISVTGVVLALGVNLYQRQSGNADERATLRQIAVQTVPLCGAPEPAMLQSLQKLNGPLQVILRGEDVAPPWNSPETLLKWGVPTLRYGDRDYSLINSLEASVLTSRAATGAAAAFLTISSQVQAGRDSIHLQLTDASGQNLAQQTWAQLNPKGQMCPRYIVSPAAGEQPRKLLTQTLHLADTGTAQLIDFDHYWAIIGAILPAQIVSRSNSDAKAAPDSHCPVNVGWVKKNTDPLQISFDPFQVQQSLFFVTDAAEENVRCDADRVFFYRAWTLGKEHQGAVRIEARSLTDFKLLWAGMIPLTEVTAETQPKSMVIRSLEPTSAGLTIEFLNVQSGRSAVVNLPNIITD